MRTVDLLEPYLQGGLRTTNYYNGAALTAEQLEGDQKANAFRHRQLGQLVGEGVGRGFEVAPGAAGSSRGPRTLLVAPGLAVNRAGAILVLPQAIEIALRIPGLAPVAPKPDRGRFGPCDPADRLF